MCNHLKLKILIHIFTITCLIMIIIIMRGENFVAHRLRITGLEYGYVLNYSRYQLKTFNLGLEHE
jgi:hypothetical protein